MECEPVNDTRSAGKGDDDRKGRWSVETYVVLGIIIWDYLELVGKLKQIGARDEVGAEATGRRRAR